LQAKLLPPQHLKRLSPAIVARLFVATPLKAMAFPK
jgi:hypothetical protein